MNSNHQQQPNVWRTIAWTVIAVMAVVYIWRTTEGSNDLQLLLLGAAASGLICYGIGFLMGRGSVGATRLRAEEYKQAFERGHDVGVTAGYRAAIAEDTPCEVAVPARQQAVVMVRR